MNYRILIDTGKEKPYQDHAKYLHPLQARLNDLHSLQFRGRSIQAYAKVWIPLQIDDKGKIHDLSPELLQLLQSDPNKLQSLLAKATEPQPTEPKLELVTTTEEPL